MVATSNYSAVLAAMEVESEEVNAVPTRIMKYHSDCSRESTDAKHGGHFKRGGTLLLKRHTAVEKADRLTRIAE